MRISRIAFYILLTLFLSLSCEKGYITDCELCYENEPGKIYLDIFVMGSIDGSVAHTVTIYEGKIEDNIVLRTITSTQDRFNVSAFLYKNYTIVVEYTVEGTNYTAIDEACPELRYDETACEYPCYYVYGNVVEMNLRYL